MVAAAKLLKHFEVKPNGDGAVRPEDMWIIAERFSDFPLKKRAFAPVPRCCLEASGSRRAMADS